MNCFVAEASLRLPQPGLLFYRLSRRRRASPDELAKLTQLYWQQVHEFNTTDHVTDEEANAHAQATFEASMERMIGIPAKSADDALAALDWLIKEEADLGGWYDGPSLFHRATASLVSAIRGYIENARAVA